MVIEHSESHHFEEVNRGKSPIHMGNLPAMFDKT